MEKLLNPYDKEFMRRAMLMHEKTFKEQVYELHRLYRIQKILMKNIESSRSNGRSQELWNSSSRNGISIIQANQHHNTQHKPSMMLDLEQPADMYIPESNGDGMLEIIDESEIQLTLGPTNYTRRRKKPQTTRTSSNSGASFSSSSTGSSHINRTNIRAREVIAGTELGLVRVPDILKKEEILKQQERIDQQQPAWLLQVLSLNIT